jgi:hypothetical protein
MHSLPCIDAAENGKDSHLNYRKNATYRGKKLNYHLKPFRPAVGAWYADLFCGELGFEGIAVSGWVLIASFITGG